MSAPSLRLFVAASLPDEHLAWVGEQVAAIRDAWPGARWIPLENQHVTVKFLGSTAEGKLTEVASRCGEAAAAHGPAPIGLARLGVFPSPKRARVLWIGLEDPAGLLTSLAGALDDRLAPLGIEPERRAFSAHLTVARFKVPNPVGALPSLSGPPGPFSLTEIGLWRSHLSPKGARYERLRSFQLGAIDHVL